MAILFNEKEFEDLILEKGKEFGDLVVTNVELEAFKKGGHLEYLFYVYSFCEKLKENNILFLTRFNDYPSYMMKILGLDDFDYSISKQKSLEYNHDGKNQFDIYIPSGKREEAIDLFSQIVSCTIYPDNPIKLFFGKNEEYQIGLIQHEYLYRLSNINKDKLKNIRSSDQAVINYMVQADDNYYHMPNLYGCVVGRLDFWYSLINATKPKSLEDFTIINLLLYGTFNSKKTLFNHIEEYGLGGVICCKEQMYRILCDDYNISKEKVDGIRRNQMNTHRLTKADKKLLESNKVPNNVISQLNNIRYLPSSTHTIINVELVYRLAYIKYYYHYDFMKSLHHFETLAYVGPFFYIDNRVYASTKLVNDFALDLRFFDFETSHFVYFDSLDIEGDYGNYPRGRVIYDNYHQRFIVYLDRILMKKEIEEKIINKFNLVEEVVVFKSDAHYTHDGL